MYHLRGDEGTQDKAQSSKGGEEDHLKKSLGLPPHFHCGCGEETGWKFCRPTAHTVKAEAQFLL